MRMPNKPKRPHLERHPVEDDGVAFLPDLVREGGVLDDETEALAEEFVAQATSAEDVGEDARDEMVAEELGGPFLELQVRPEDALGAEEDEPIADGVEP